MNPVRNLLNNKVAADDDRIGQSSKGGQSIPLVRRQRFSRLPQNKDEPDLHWQISNGGEFSDNNFNLK